MAAKQEVAKAPTANDQLPAYLQNQGPKVKIGNVDESDLIIPRVKLLQAISPEVETYENAKAGNFWHALAGEPMGNSLKFTPILVRKSYVLWSPRGDQRGILARSNDAVNWNVKDVFKVRPKGSATEVIWSTEAGTVRASGLAEFGSSIPGNPNSQPAAALVYEFLVYFPDYPEFSPSLLLNTRSSVKPGKALVNKIDIRPTNIYGQQYIVKPVKEEGPEGPYYNYSYASDGYATEEVYEYCKMLYEKYSGADFKASDEADEATVGTDTGAGAKF